MTTTVADLHRILENLMQAGHGNIPVKVIYEPQYPKEADLQGPVRMYALHEEEGTVPSEKDVIYLVAAPGTADYSCRAPWSYPDGIL